jgi:8-oxo-dGTP diphosphatase
MNRAAPRQVFHAYAAAVPGAGEEVRFCPRCAAACTRAVIAGRARTCCAACGYVHFRNPAPGVAIVVRQAQRVLLGQRAPRRAFAGRWAFPAGFIEFDEDFLSAARREAKEETGLEIAVTGILNVTTNYLSRRLHALVVAVAAEPVGGTLRAGDEFRRLRWVSLAGPLPPLAYEADAHLLRALRSASLRQLPVDTRYAAGTEPET